ncbi:hypothetical protein EVAR_86321_1 [Eumeta japonica]|uniref:RNA-directed DNA polymerase from mobile element jockey n=1 Tax=Eumeta variegata TaxID=151549 RepID=A0A4C1X718_EUMVA|nr:hypothetical protein EVAR_86321_1 [Eumeta japonica]
MHEVEQLTSFETMRLIGIKVGSSDHEIKLFAAYKPPGELNAKHKAWGSYSTSRAGRLLMEDAKHQVHGPDTSTHVPINMRHRPNVLDIVLGRKIRRPVHVEVLYGMDTQHLPILVTVETDNSNSPQAILRQRMAWENF